MNWIQHFRESRKTDGILTSLLTPLPDLFPYRLHNTLEGIDYMGKFRLSKPWKLHYEQDKESHPQFGYDYLDIVPKGSIMLLSGGLDSFIQWRLLQYPRAVYFAIGHDAQDKEIKCLEQIQKKFGGDITIDHSLPFLGKYALPSGFIPYRNLFFIMLASLYSQNVVIAQIAEWAPDKNHHFYRRTEKLLKKIGQGKFQGIDIKPKIYAPFSNKSKTELVRMYLRRWPAEDLTKYTVSCYSGLDIACGKCNGCFSRYIAMKNNRIEEPYIKIPSYDDFKKKLDWHDFRFRNIPMYVKRLRELREFKKNEISKS